MELASAQVDLSGSMGGRPAADVLFWDPVHAWRWLLAELVGTLLLTFVAAGGDTIEAATHQALGHVAKVVAPALMVMALIYAIGGLSGAI